MVYWKATVDKINNFLNSKNFLEAKKEIDLGLKKIPNQFNLLSIATDVYRESGDREMSLKYAERLITHHTNHPSGYVFASQNLLALKRFEEAKAIINEGIDKFPNQLYLLIFSTDVYRASGDREKSLKYAQLLITHHTNHPSGYLRASQDLIALKRLEEAKAIINAGIDIFENPNLLLIKENLNNDLNNLERLRVNQINSNYFDKISSRNVQKKYLEGNNQNTFCILLRCTHFKDSLVKELSNQLLTLVPKSNIWFVHDSEIEDATNNVISVSKFRQSIGIDWSIIDKKGWLFGDFCYYAAVNFGLTYDYYYLIEDDVRFTNNALSLFLKSTLIDPSDFLASQIDKRDPEEWFWLKKYSYAHPNENSFYGCFFPITCASSKLIKFLFQKRIKEFKVFLKKHEFSKFEAYKYFSNDEAFTINSIYSSHGYSIKNLTKSLINKYFHLKKIHDISNIKGDHIVHKYSPNA